VCGVRSLGRRLDDSGHDPALLADLAVTSEPELLVGRQGSVEKEAGGTEPASSGYPSDRVLFTKTDGSWTKVDKGGLPNYMRQRYVSPALQSTSRSTFRRITGGMQHLKIKPGPNGTTIYGGREAAGVITRDPTPGR
jgi:hypothetical protein